MSSGIYAIRDNVAEAIVGALMLQKTDAVAVRMFGDIAAMPNSQVGMHVQDFDLVCVGQLLDGREPEIVPETRVVITGVAWQAARDAAADKPKIARIA